MNKVSVIMPTYKRSDMLDRAIHSVLNQTYSNVEVVVIDDNDPQSSWRITTEKKMKQYAGDSRVKYVRHECNKNGSAARNTGIREATGEIITFLDDDDMYKPDKIAKEVEYLESHNQFRAVYCGWYRDGYNILPEGEGDLSYGILSGYNLIITNTIMMWKRDAIECGGWDENLTRHQEAAFLLNFFRYGGLIGRIGEVLVEFDTSDRANVAKAELNESQLMYFLKSNKDLIQRCEESHEGDAAKIYSSRYFGIVLPYMKNGQYTKAFAKYTKFFFRMPLPMLRVAFKYIKRRMSSDYIKQTR